MTRAPFVYAAIRLVPRIDRGECVNAGVVLYCQAHDFLDARIHLDETRLRILDPAADLAVIRLGLNAWVTHCAGGPGAGPSGKDTPGRRFRWLTAPRSTVIQPGPVHGGLTENPADDLERLHHALVL